MKTERVVLTEANYENAFGCMNGGCPQTSGPQGCPLWVEVTVNTAMAEDVGSVGASRVISGCAPVVTVESQLENTLSNVLSLNSVQDLRNQIVEDRQDRMSELRVLGEDVGWLKRALFFVGRKVEQTNTKVLTDAK